jgi:hypothetical protein
MSEPSQGKVVGIIVGVSIAGIFFLLFVIAVLHWCSRTMHRNVVGHRGSSESVSECSEV